MKNFLIGVAVALACAAMLPMLVQAEYYYVLGFTVLQLIIMATA